MPTWKTKMKFIPRFTLSMQMLQNTKNRPITNKQNTQQRWISSQWVWHFWRLTVHGVHQSLQEVCPKMKPMRLAFLALPVKPLVMWNRFHLSIQVGSIHTLLLDYGKRFIVGIPWNASGLLSNTISDEICMTGFSSTVCFFLEHCGVRIKRRSSR